MISGPSTCAVAVTCIQPTNRQQFRSIAFYSHSIANADYLDSFERYTHTGQRPQTEPKYRDCHLEFGVSDIFFPPLSSM